MFESYASELQSEKALSGKLATTRVAVTNKSIQLICSARFIRERMEDNAKLRKRHGDNAKSLTSINFGLLIISASF